MVYRRLNSLDLIDCRWEFRNRIQLVQEFWGIPVTDTDGADQAVLYQLLHLRPDFSYTPCFAGNSWGVDKIRVQVSQLELSDISV